MEGGGYRNDDSVPEERPALPVKGEEEFLLLSTPLPGTPPLGEVRGTARLFWWLRSRWTSELVMEEEEQGEGLLEEMLRLLPTGVMM